MNFFLESQCLYKTKNIINLLQTYLKIIILEEVRHAYSASFSGWRVSLIYFKCQNIEAKSTWNILKNYICLLSIATLIKSRPLGVEAIFIRFLLRCHQL